MPKIIINGEEAELGGSRSSGGGEIYSTEETRIGTWIDGKPLYKVTRLYNGSFATSISTLTLDTFQNIDKCVYFNAAVRIIQENIANESTYFTSNFSNLGVSPSNKDYFLFALKGDGRLVLSNQWNYSNDFEIIITMKYTKTTDQPSTASTNT